jgi:hypothetical protein
MATLNMGWVAPHKWRVAGADQVPRTAPEPMTLGAQNHALPRFQFSESFTRLL